MLENALLYEDQIERYFKLHMYDLKTNYVFGSHGCSIEPYEKDNLNSHQFASVDKGFVHGIMGYQINWETRSVGSLYIINCYNKPSPLFIRDTLHMIDDIFNKYNLNRISWRAYADNPAVNGYRKFCKRYGGREVGILRQTVLLLDGQLHDEVLFELLKEDYINARRA